MYYFISPTGINIIAHGITMGTYVEETTKLPKLISYGDAMGKYVGQFQGVQILKLH